MGSGKKMRERPEREGTPAPLPADAAAPAPPAPRKPTGFGTLLLHVHPRAVPEEALTFSRTFGLGGMAVALLGLLAVTGALLLFSYDPSTERAYASVLTLRDRVPFGGFLRAAHHWAANGLILAAFLHMLRAFFTGAHLERRRFNWVLGLALLVLVMGSNFTGYLLPWDQLSYWAVTICTGMLGYIPLAGEALKRALRGGDEVGPKTLSIFFVLHIAILPILLALLCSFHFWLVRKAGGVVLPAQGADGDARRVTVPTSPHLVFREGVAALAITAAVLWAAALFAAPLLEQANPGMSPSPAKAPWYFMGFQELLVHLHPAFAILAVPLLMAAFLVWVAYGKGAEAHSGRWFHSERGRRMALAGAGTALLAVPIYVFFDGRVIALPKLLPFLPPALSGGLIPVALALVLPVVFARVLRTRFGATRTEAIQGVFALCVTAFAVLTVTGIFFRGEGMRLCWPW
jgi:quinol-cytochrome oxidoreductase complex cytochrome b subunit